MINNVGFFTGTNTDPPRVTVPDSGSALPLYQFEVGLDGNELLNAFKKRIGDSIYQPKNDETMRVYKGAGVRSWMNTSKVLPIVALQWRVTLVCYGMGELDNVKPTTQIFLYNEVTDTVTYYFQHGIFHPPNNAICIYHCGNHYQYVDSQIIGSNVLVFTTGNASQLLTLRCPSRHNITSERAQYISYPENQFECDNGTVSILDPVDDLLMTHEATFTRKKGNGYRIGWCFRWLQGQGDFYTKTCGMRLSSGALETIQGAKQRGSYQRADDIFCSNVKNTYT